MSKHRIRTERVLAWHWSAPAVLLKPLPEMCLLELSVQSVSNQHSCVIWDIVCIRPRVVANSHVYRSETIETVMGKVYLWTWNALLSWMSCDFSCIHDPRSYPNSQCASLVSPGPLSLPLVHMEDSDWSCLALHLPSSTLRVWVWMDHCVPTKGT